MTCLLICYNPRDNIEQMLIKAGNITHKVFAPTTQLSTMPSRGRL